MASAVSAGQGGKLCALACRFGSPVPIGPQPGSGDEVIPSIEGQNVQNI